MQFLKSWGRAAGAAALLAALSACGGGGSDSAADQPIAVQVRQAVVPVADASLCASGASGYAELDGQCRAVSEALGVMPKIKTTATATITADQFFAWAQTNFAAFFPGNPSTVTANGFVYRGYSTGNAIAVTTSVLNGLASGTILVLGPVTGNALTPLGTLSGFNCTVAPANCTPTNPGPGTGGSGNYADCFSGALLMTPGHTYQIDLSNSVNGVVQQTTSNKYTVNNQTTFKGNTAIELVIDTTSVTNGIPATSRVKNYSYLTGDFYSTYGQVISLSVPVIGSYDMTTYYDPPLKTPTNLASGQTYTVNTTMKYESSNALFNSFLPTNVAINYVFTFLGKETVTTPAGTFSACKTTSPVVSSTGTTLTTSWAVAEGRYKGMFLKSDDGKGTVSVATKLLFDGS